MLTRIATLSRGYPRQFWLLFFGMMISTIGASMIWPFLMIYLSERLDLPDAAVASLLTINATMGFLSAFAAGPITDRLGRKWVMVVSLAVNGLYYLLMNRADTLLEFAVLMGVSGAFNPLYRVGADAMMADLIPPEQRPDAYSLLRTSNNVGVALGPVLGGFFATISYSIAFHLAAGGMIAYALLVAFLAAETLAIRAGMGAPHEAVRERFGGYDRILRDRRFMSFVLSFILTQGTAAILWVMLGKYVKQNFGILENQYSLLPMTNALMVVLFQYLVTQWTKRRSPLRMIALGSLLYAVAMVGIGAGRSFGFFWVCMVVFTLGELILSPPSTVYAANLAPADMRGRYMSLYGLTWNAGSGTGPVLGGLLSDRFGPAATWYGAAVMGLFAAASFWVKRDGAVDSEQRAVDGER